MLDGKKEIPRGDCPFTVFVLRSQARMHTEKEEEIRRERPLAKKLCQEKSTNPREVSRSRVGNVFFV